MHELSSVQYSSCEMWGDISGIELQVAAQVLFDEQSVIAVPSRESGKWVSLREALRPLLWKAMQLGEVVVSICYGNNTSCI